MRKERRADSGDRQPPGWIYFLTNPAMPGLVKVGHTGAEVENRARSLYNTAVPAPFEVAASFRVANSLATEQALHAQLDAHRFNDDREFFAGELSMLISASLPILFGAMPRGASSQSGAAPNPVLKHDIDDRSVELLRHLTGERKQTGYDVFDLLNDKEPELEVEYRLAKLKRLGYAAEKRGTGGERRLSLWRITSEGVAFLFDHQLVEPYMLQRRFFP